MDLISAALSGRIPKERGIPTICSSQRQSDTSKALTGRRRRFQRDWVRSNIEGFSHLIVLWEFDRSEGFSLVGTPPSDNRPHGVFATRSPLRPNPIGLTVVELLSREGAVLRVRGIDMLDGTPILDVKPYLSNVPPERLRRGWLAEAEARRGGKP